MSTEEYGDRDTLRHWVRTRLEAKDDVAIQQALRGLNGSSAETFNNVVQEVIQRRTFPVGERRYEANLFAIPVVVVTPAVPRHRTQYTRIATMKPLLESFRKWGLTGTGESVVLLDRLVDDAYIDSLSSSQLYSLVNEMFVASLDAGKVKAGTLHSRATRLPRDYLYRRYLLGLVYRPIGRRRDSPAGYDGPVAAWRQHVGRHLTQELTEEAAHAPEVLALAPMPIQRAVRRAHMATLQIASEQLVGELHGGRAVRSRVELSCFSHIPDEYRLTITLDGPSATCESVSLPLKERSHGELDQYLRSLARYLTVLGVPCPRHQYVIVGDHGASGQLQ